MKISQIIVVGCLAGLGIQNHCGLHAADDKACGRQRSDPFRASVTEPALPDLTDRSPKLVAPAQFTLPDDLEITVWATRPMPFNPTNMDTDAAGRIYVAEGVNYRKHETRRVEGDRIVILEDTDGDGTADKSHTFDSPARI